MVLKFGVVGIIEKDIIGETLNGIPNGQGYSETYETHEIIRKTFKVVPKNWKDKYFKSSLKKKDIS